MAISLFSFILLLSFGSPNPSFALPPDTDSDFSILTWHDYSPPSPPPPPPSPTPPYASCESDLGGTGDFDTLCEVLSSKELSSHIYINGNGSLVLLAGVSLTCPLSGCEIVANLSGHIKIGVNSKIVAGRVVLASTNISLSEGTVVDTTGLAGDPPPRTSGAPTGTHGDGGGYGGRGASCYIKDGQTQEDSWGGDPYDWTSLQSPDSYGSQGGSTSVEADYGGGGGGRVRIVAKEMLELGGMVIADGGDGGDKGGGGSGGSIYIVADKMKGSGNISASGGSGLAGGGGGRVSVDVFSRHDDTVVSVHGGQSSGCPENAGAAGTLYDAVPKSLIVDNNNYTTQTDTLLMEFPYQPLWTNVFVKNCAKAAVPLRWSRVQVQGQLSILSGAILTFGLTRYPYSEFELLAEELLMSDSTVKVFGGLRMSVKMLLMWNARMLIDGGDEPMLATSFLEASNLIVLKEASVIHSNANLGVHGQGLLNLSGSGDTIEAQRLILSLFYSIELKGGLRLNKTSPSTIIDESNNNSDALYRNWCSSSGVGPGSVLRGPIINGTKDHLAPQLNCESETCPAELIHPPEDCNVNTSLSFTLQICRVEDIDVSGLIEGTVVHFHRARSVTVYPSGIISATGLGCRGGIGRGKVVSSGLGGGGGHGGKGGDGFLDGTKVEGGISYGSSDLPCELGSGSGNDTVATSTAGGGIVVMGSWEHSLMSLSVYGSVESDGESFKGVITNSSTGGLGGGSGGTILLFLRTLTLGEASVLSTAGGIGNRYGGGGGGGGRIHFHWSDISTGDEYVPVASVEGLISSSGGISKGPGYPGDNGTVTGKACPEGLYGTFCKECPLGTYKNKTGSDKSFCYPCPSSEIPRRAIFVSIRGGVAGTPCPYKCVSDRYHMPHCYTALEELIYTFGGPWLFGLFLAGLLVLLALVLSVARMKFVGNDELPGPAPTQHGSQIDHSFPFLESLNEVLETNRQEESQSHVHRVYFMGPNTFSEPWHLPHCPPDQIAEIVYEDAYNRFVDEINALAAYQWWEGAVHSIVSVAAYPLAWSWQQWRRRKKLQRLREFVRSEYDHSCLRSCRSRALYEGLKVAATPDYMLGYVDFFLGGDEKRADLPPRLHQRFPMSILFGGDGSYMAPFNLHSDNVLTSLMGQAIQPTIWYRLVAGLNAQLRLVRRGCLRSTLMPVLSWLDTHANTPLSHHGVRVDLAWFQATALGYCQLGLVIYAIEGGTPPRSPRPDGTASRPPRNDRSPGDRTAPGDALLSRNQDAIIRKKIMGGVIDSGSLRTLKEKRDFFYPFSLILHNSRPVGHQDLVGLVISMLLLADFSLVLLTFLQLYSYSMVDILLVLFILPLGILSPFPAGINALFSHGPRRSAGLARVYALWNITSLVNVVVAFLCGLVHYKSSSKKHPSTQPWGLGTDESGWWLFPAGLLLCKTIQARLVDWHVANLEIQDRSLYSADPNLFWQT